MDSVKLENILNRTESDTLDFKSGQYPFAGASDEQKSELLKDIVAMANAWKEGPSYIIIGVAEKDGRMIGTPGVNHHLMDHSIQQFVTAKVNRPVSFGVKVVTYKETELNVIEISAHQQRPIFLKSDYGKLRKNIVYIRRGSSTDEALPDEIAGMGRAEAETSRLSFPQMLIEFAHPYERNRWGTEKRVKSLDLKERPKSAAKQPAGDAMKSKKPQNISKLGLIAESGRMPWQMAEPFKKLVEERRQRTIRHLQERANYAAVSFWIQNAGIINASNVRVEIEIPLSPMLEISSGNMLPVRRSMDELVMPHASPFIRVSRDRHAYRMELEPGTLQPKQEYWEPGFFIVSSWGTVDAAFNLRVFADDLPNPVESNLLLHVSREERLLEEDEIEKQTGTNLF